MAMNTNWLSNKNRERLIIIKEAGLRLRDTFRATPEPERAGYPVPIRALREKLEAAGVVRGSNLLVHASMEKVLTAWPEPDDGTPTNALGYAQALINMMLDAVGPEGCLLMPTESKLAGSTVKQYLHGTLFDYQVYPSSRGLLSELFRRQEATLRSAMPWYNISAQGKEAEYFLKDHAKAAPYPMGPNSPWFRMLEGDTKILFLDVPFGKNTISRIPENTHHEVFRHPIYYDRPLDLKYLDWDRQEKTVSFYARVIGNQAFELEKWAGYINQKEEIYFCEPLGESTVRWVDAGRQQHHLMAELEKGISPFFARTWSEDLMEGL